MPGWTPQQIEQFQEYWDALIEGNQARTRQVRWGPDGAKLTVLRQPPLQDSFDEWLARIVQFAFSLPPTPYVKQMNRSSAETAADTALKEGLAPLKTWIKELIDDLIQHRLGYKELEFRWRNAEAVDPAVRAEVLTTFQRHAVYSVNEVRAKLGEEPIARPWADARVVATTDGVALIAARKS